MFQTFAETYFHEEALWLLVVYTAVMVAMIVDLACGLHKSRRRGRKCTSRGFKQTCDKAVKYFLPMICLTCVDLIASAVVSLPFLTMLMGIYNIFCELKSILETTHDKAEIEQCAELAQKLLGGDSRAILDILKEELRKK